MNLNTLGSINICTCAILLILTVFPTQFLFSNNKPWQLTCPADYTVQLQPNQCNGPVFFEDLDWTSTDPVLDTVFLPPSGTTFSLGNHTITLAVTTVGGVLQSCTFKLTVQEFFPNTLDCQVAVQINLNGVCEAPIPASALLMLDSAGCVNNYIAGRLDANNQVLPPVVTHEDIGKPPFQAVAQHINANLQCITSVTVTGNLPPSITCPPDLTIDCNIPLLPSITGRPDTTGCFENIAIAFTDQFVNADCQDDFAFQVVRTWAGTDPTGKVSNCQQFISGNRVSIAGVVFPLDHDGTNQPILACSDGIAWQETAHPIQTGRPILNGYAANTNLACDITVNFVDVAENICGASYFIERVWTVVNLCDQANFRRDTQYIFVLDTLPPAFNLPDTIYASTSGSCFDSLLLPAVDLIRECSGFFVEIQTPWDTLYTDGGWTHIQQDSGLYPVIYTVTDECGWVKVDTVFLKVENKTVVGCPPTVSIDCDKYFTEIAPAISINNFDLLNDFGVPEYHLNCGFGFSQTNVPTVNNCGVGTILRTFEADSSGVPTCTQIIAVTHVSNFRVSFPVDLGICSAPGTANLPTPEVTGVSCENTAISFSDAVTQSGVPGCYTVKRTWTVTNTCSFTGNNSQDDTLISERLYQDGGDGVVRYVQTITVNDRPGPAFPNGCDLPDRYLLQNSCEVTVTVPTPQVLSCEILDFYLTGDLGIEMGKNVKLSPGTYEMTYTAVDECGKTGVCEAMFTVFDTIPPTASCKQGLMVEMLPTQPPMVEVLATQLNNNSFDNCGGTLEFFIMENGTLSSGKIFNDCCNDVGANILTLAVKDAYGNQSTCQSTVTIQTNISGCDCSEIFGGNISTEESEGIKNVQVTITSNIGPSVNLLTDAMGNYSTLVEPDGDYTVSPSKNDNHSNGVTTFDGVLITKHILGVELLDSPYKIIAADINKSNTVTTFDIVELRKLVLQVNTNFPSNTSWRFVPANFVFTNPVNPFGMAFPEVINLNNISQGIIDLDFIGIKIGDVNGSATP